MERANSQPLVVPSAEYVSPSVSDSFQISSQILCLEELPFDVRHHILSWVGTIVDLSALVHASPIFHEQYAADRDSWLCRCL
jgi:hypothetical protein